MKNRITIPQSQRIDKMLSRLLNVSRNQIEKLIRGGSVEVNGRVVTKTSYKLAIGDEVEYEFVEAQESKSVGVDFDIDTIYEDDDILIINKPSGIVVHPAPSVKSATVVDWLIDRGISLSTISGEERHGIVHRIDKETTGALVVAKNSQAHQNLSQQLQDKSMGRYYLALIDYPLKEDIVVDKPIARSPKNRLKMDIVEGGRDAKTSFVKLSEGRGDIELIVAKLYTGRTHQIRVHLATLGRHILGDELYGYRGKHSLVDRVNLHAYLLYLIHPTSGKKMEFVAPIHSDMEKLLYQNFDMEIVKDKIVPYTIGDFFNPNYRV